AEIRQALLRVTTPPQLRLDPDLLQLDRAFRPGGGLRLEEDLPVPLPDPATALLDLRPCAPLEEGRVAGICVDPHLLQEGRGRGPDQQVEVAETSGAQAAAAGRGRLFEHVDRLTGPVLTDGRQRVPRRFPDLAHRRFVPYEHSRS